MERLNLEYVLIEKIENNPLNPRRNLLQDTERLQAVIKKNGFETAITCYKKDGKYIILSGHRRVAAACQMGIKIIPVYVVPAPETVEEELDRLSSVQGGKQDWTTYEWGKHLFNLSTNNHENWSIKELSYKTGKGVKVVREALKVFNYYPHQEIENQLATDKLSITILARIVDFINDLKAQHPNVVNDLTEDLIRDSLVYKAENKKITTTQLRSDTLLESADIETLKRFFRTPKMKYSDATKTIGIDEINVDSKLKRFLKTIQTRSNEISQIDFNNNEDSLLLMKDLEVLKINIQLKKEEIENFINK
ncbi:ParB N-terminal domain-containing protein [Sporosarcina sp. 179-K 8C2 HS]|uniref:ParB/RepB/Spo0J family partition protein n=1 Tax=Sporosarcina sp. 179-K 8C2 HS TaxID=3142387 RepID=UPI0039A17A4C